MKALYSHSEIELLLHKCGFELSDELDDIEITKRYFSEYNKCNLANHM